jgi:hypothetical protein
MKIFLFALISFALISTQIEAKSFTQNENDKRFLGGWINNVINTVTDAVTSVYTTVVDNVINPVVDGVNTAINTIGGINVNNLLDSFVDTVWKPVQNTVVDGYNQVVGGVNTAVDAVGNIVSSLGGSSESGQPEPDFCNLRCKAVDKAGSEYYYDQSNGCVSKGFSALPYNFNSCCDNHNMCLNSKCCTSECQTLKNDCDLNYKRCLRSICSRIDDFDDMDKCTNLANVVSNYANSSGCNPNESRNRKLCIC